MNRDLNSHNNYPERTDTFFLISNYNTDPELLLKYCTDYHIYDQSDNGSIKAKLAAKYSKITFVENSGHSLTNYFRYFSEKYDSLPPLIMLIKANMIGRHITQEYFDRVYSNRYFTALYDDRKWADKPGIAYQLYDGAFLETNNSWYAFAKPYRYFLTFNDLLRFLFKDPIIPEWILFSPGACYIVSKEQVVKYPAAFYKNLMYLVSYTYFPSEAYHVERILNILFNANYELNEYCLDEEKFRAKLQTLDVGGTHGAKWRARGRRKITEIKHRIRLKFRRIHKFLYMIGQD